MSSQSDIHTLYNQIKTQHYDKPYVIRICKTSNHIEIYVTDMDKATCEISTSNLVKLCLVCQEDLIGNELDEQDCFIDEL